VVGKIYPREEGKFVTRKRKGVHNSFAEISPFKKKKELAIGALVNLGRRGSQGEGKVRCPKRKDELLKAKTKKINKNQPQKPPKKKKNKNHTKKLRASRSRPWIKTAKKWEEGREQNMKGGFLEKYSVFHE